MNRRFALDDSGNWLVCKDSPWQARDICREPMREPPTIESTSGLYAAGIDSYVAALSVNLRESILAKAESRLRRDAQQRAFDAYCTIVKITTDVFGEPVQIKSTYDPSFPDERYILFIAETDAPARQVLEMESDWNRQVSAVTSYWHGIRLSIKRKK